MEKLSNKSKKIIILGLCILLSIPLSAVILVGIITLKEKAYYKKTNWNIAFDCFKETCVPVVEMYFNAKMYEAGYLNSYMEVKNEEEFMISYKNKKSEICISFLPTEDYCLFNLTGYFYESNITDFDYSCFENLDIVINDFASFAFYEFPINNSPIYDCLDEGNELNGSIVYYFDSLIGNLGTFYYIYPNDESYVCNLTISTLLRDGQSFIDNLKARTNE